MRKIKRLISFTALMLPLFILSSCELSELSKGDTHVHTFEEEWTTDKVGHWYKPTCEHDLFGSYDYHSFGDWTIVTEATPEADGLKERTCSVCGYKETKKIYYEGNSKYDVIYEGNYYDSIDTALLNKPLELKEALHNLVSNNPKKLSYDNAFDALNTIDSYDGGDFVECLYTGEKMDPANHGYWNREHVWAKSHGIKTKDDKSSQRNSAYTDLHHLRATENTINSTRNNRYFDEVTHDSTRADLYGNFWDNGDAFEPRNEVKGDIARMLFYMVIRYEGDASSEYLDLELTDNLELAKQSNNYEYGTTQTITGYLGKLSTLIKWSFEDPVDSREISRNNAIEKVQGNRNPFIDHPEFVFYLYSEEAITLEYELADLSELIKPVLKDNTLINNVENLISSIGSVTVDSNDAITKAKDAYDKLDNVSKSFVSNYKVLKDAIEEYRIVSTVQDVNANTTFSFLTLKGTKVGKLFENGVYLDYETTAGNAPSDKYGIYSQNNKPVTLKAKGLYTNIKNVVLKMDVSGSDAISGTITISDGTNNVTNTFSVNSLNDFATDITSLDLTKDITITISSGSSWRIRSITFSI